MLIPWGIAGVLEYLKAVSVQSAHALASDFESGPGSHPNILQGLPRTSRDVQQQALIPEVSVLLFSANVH
jgi:hypothetical protein